MSLFSFFRKNKQEATSTDGDYYSRAEEDSVATQSRSRRRGKTANEPTDPMLPEKKRARRRLIGASALVLAAVIGLPMILDSEPKPLADNIEIDIPTKDRPAAGRMPAPAVPVAPEAALDQSEELVASAPDQDKPGQAQKASVNAKTPVAVNSPSAAPAATEAPAKPEQGTAAKPAASAPAPETKLSAKPEPVVSSRSDDGARAQAILEGKFEQPATANKKAGSFMVQVAALSSQEKINELRAKLKQAGMTSHTQKVATASGERTRIRVGPFASREEAEKARAKLANLGLNGTLVPIGQ